MTVAAEARGRTAASPDAPVEPRFGSARQELGALREAIEQRIAAVTASLTSLDVGALLDPVAEALSRAALEQAEAAASRARLEAQEVAHAQLVAERAEGQARVDAELASNVALREALDVSHRQLHALQHDMAALQEQYAAIAAQLGNEQTARASLVESFDGERAHLQRERDEVHASLAGETRERMALATTLAEAREAASRAKAEAEQSRATLDRVRHALQALDAVTSASDVLETLVAQLGHEFGRAAVFLVRASRLEGWRGVGLDPSIAITNLVVPLTVEAPLTRALRDKTSVRLSANGNGEPIGYLGGPVTRAIAVPILTSGHVIAVAYAEQVQESLGDDADSDLRMAEILGDHVSRSLTAIAARASVAPRNATAPVDKTKDSAPQYPGPARQAPRVRMPDGIEVQVDSSVGVLIDISSLGAQVVSSKAMRPNHTVRLVLPQEEGALPCNGRIVWAACEMSHSRRAAVYRAGVHFTGVDAGALGAFLMRYGGS